MKLKIALIVLVLLFPIISLAAGTCDLQNYHVSYSGLIRHVTYRCTAHTDNSLSYPFSDAEMSWMDGGYVYYVTVDPATATTCTDASDLALTDELGLTPLTATGNGLDLVDSTTTTGSIPENLAGSDWYYPVAGNSSATSSANNLTIDMTGNSVAECTFDITFLIDKIRNNQ